MREPQAADAVRRTERTPEQTAGIRRQLKPLAVDHVCFTAGNMAELACVGQDNLETRAVQNLKERYPVHPSAFHGDGLDALLLEPIGSRTSSGVVRAEARHIRNGRHPVGGPANPVLTGT